METGDESDRNRGMFWSGETLRARLPSLISPYFPDRVDCASYLLAIGEEVYVSPSDQSSDPKKVTVRRLAPDEAFTVPPGQFAFLLTEESVEIPRYAIGFISIRAKTKFRGLVNVSGFHIDPGFRGQLTLAVFNAGPITVHLKRGQRIFPIWYAGLDRFSDEIKKDPPRRGIDPEIISGIAGELQSFASLKSKIDDVDDSLDKRMQSLERAHEYYKATAAVIGAVVVGLLISWLRTPVVPPVAPSVPTPMPPQSMLNIQGPITVSPQQPSPISPEAPNPANSPTTQTPPGGTKAAEPSSQTKTSPPPVQNEPPPLSTK